VEALAVGHRPGRGRAGRSAQARLARLPLPRALSLGLAMPFARPGRSLTTVAAVLLGTVGVTFGAGLAISLNKVQDGISRDSAGAVLVVPFLGPGSGRPKLVTPADLAAATTVIGAQPGTRAWFGVAPTALALAGSSARADVLAYQGDSSFGGYQMVSGSWFHRPGEAVAPKSFLTRTGVHVGDTVTLAHAGRTASVRIVGEILSLHDALLTDRASIASLDPGYVPDMTQFDVDLRPGTDQATYLAALNRALAPEGMSAMSNAPHAGLVVLAMDTLAFLLSLMLVTVAGLGVLNSVLLDTRERVSDLGVMKALGMTPRQTVAMVLTSVSASGLAAGVAGVPIGVALHHLVLPAMAGAAGTDVPSVDLAVFHLPVLLPLVLGGLLLAALGALPPATWAARTRTATALRTE
jgi:putative ABC transport system permease protein